jgi:hypothetical protein
MDEKSWMWIDGVDRMRSAFCGLPDFSEVPPAAFHVGGTPGSVVAALFFDVPLPSPSESELGGSQYRAGEVVLEFSDVSDMRIALRAWTLNARAGVGRWAFMMSAL